MKSGTKSKGRILKLAPNWAQAKGDAHSHWQDFYTKDPQRIPRDGGELADVYGPQLKAQLAGDDLPPRALDFGCGAGQDCQRLGQSGLEIHGVDLAESAIAAARAHYPAGIYHQVEAGQPLPYADGYFGALHARNVLSCDFDDAALLALRAEWRRLLAPGGLLLLSVRSTDDSTFRQLPNARPGWISLGGVGLHFFSRRTLKAWLSPFEIVSLEGRGLKSDPGLHMLEVVARKTH